MSIMNEAFVMNSAKAENAVYSACSIPNPEKLNRDEMVENKTIKYRSCSDDISRIAENPKDVTYTQRKKEK